ncbi:uncharacterized protein METZ01_LOCUS33246 [marine metagenome]|jgi:sec-independent protein translocase protein TatA|uniref:Sec-independent protein translocase protein TatA n=1 Tax=marine metagenome TaxID=408172 RepID=A0A381QM29_9ZZZZ|nr:twin-arginine translocase TatA/TatE family subunit [Candidatus Neomarinimicrobiota bacterium]|tara:strand:- start:281 stop:511 length:231 start_codon:yes stop_codon:yes gene_type:complete
MDENRLVYALFNLGPMEIFFIVVVILVLFGAKRIPEIAKGIGQGIREFKGAVDGAKKDIENVGKEIESENGEKSPE